MARQLNLFGDSKRLSGCVYCGRKATTKDHVPPRLLLEEPFPENLVTVKACLDCNQKLSGHQQYFLAVLAQTGARPALLAKVDDGGKVDRMLTKSIGLDERMIAQLRVDENGRPCIEPQMERLKMVAVGIAKGLYFKRYGCMPDPEPFRVVALGPEESVLNGGIPASMFASLFSPRFRSKRWSRIQEGVFEYAFLRDGTSRKLIHFARYHRTLLAVVECPNPSPRKELSRRRRGKHEGTEGLVTGA